MKHFKVFVLVTFILLSAGVLYFVLQPEYDEYFISKPDHPKTFRVLAEKNEKDSLVIKVDGQSDADYGLRLDVYSVNEEQNVLQHSYSEMIKIPAGEIHAAFKRSLQNNSSQAYLTYIPEPGKKIKGPIVLKTGFF